MSYELVNIENRNTEEPATFRIYPRQDREGLRIGDFAKLIFDDKERMWVRVKETKEGRYKGTLRNTPVLVNLELGQEIEFGPENISDIWRGV